MDNVIKELKLKLGEKEVALTMDEAKKLKDALDDLSGKNVIREGHRHDHQLIYPRGFTAQTHVYLEATSDDNKNRYEKCKLAN